MINRLLSIVPTCRQQIIPERSMVGIMPLMYNVIFRTAKARDFKFCAQVGHAKCEPLDDKLSSSKHGQSHAIHLLILGSRHIFEIGKARHSKFGFKVTVLSTSICRYTYDSITQYGVCSGSRDLLKFWQIRINKNLENATRQRKTYNGKQIIRKSM